MTEYPRLKICIISKGRQLDIKISYIDAFDIIIFFYLNQERQLQYSYAHADLADVLEAGTLGIVSAENETVGGNVSTKANYEKMKCA